MRNFNILFTKFKIINFGCIKKTLVREESREREREREKIKYLVNAKYLGCTSYSTYMELLRSVGVLLEFVVEIFVVVIVATISRLCSVHSRVIDLQEISEGPISLFTAFRAD